MRLKLWEQNEISINVLVTRDQLNLYGNLSKSMKRLGYKVNRITLNLQPSININPIINKDFINQQVKEFKYTLSKGEIQHIPSFLLEAVENCAAKIVEKDVHGIFIPPTPTSTLFSSMITYVESGFKQVRTADMLHEFYKIFDELCNEVAIILAARKLGIPVFGSCHGAQLLWYMHGGELYSMPDFSTTNKKRLRTGRGDLSTDITKFRIEDGCLKNTNHKIGGIYYTSLNTVYKEDLDYESDPEEEKDKDYDHNLLMVVSKEKWELFNAKMHPNMENSNIFHFPKLQKWDNKVNPPKLEPNLIVARSFEFGACGGTQWHPHKNVNTKSAIHYLHRFGQQCNKNKISKIECSLNNNSAQ